MRKQILLSLLLLWSAGVSLAMIPTTNQQSLVNRLAQIAGTAEGQVGTAFLDLKSGWTAQVNGSQEFPAASVAKVAIMAYAYHQFTLGALDLNQKIFFKESDKLGGSGVLQWLRGGRSYTLRNLIRMMIVLSDNTATKMVVNTLGLKNINAYLASIGLKQTVIHDPTMLVEPPAVYNNRTTPLEMARLLVMIDSAQGFSQPARQEMLSFMRNQRYRWGIWRGVPAGTKIADKTGNLDKILNDVGIIYTKQGNYVLSVFTQGFKKQRTARLLINEISRAAYEEYTGEKVITKRRSPRRPSVRSKRRSGRRGAALNRKSPTYQRR